MLNYPIILIFIVQLMTLKLESLEYCDASHCNHEGQCFIDKGSEVCHCIGDNYFRGSRCTDIVDNCLSKPCQNEGQCQNLVGQFMCRKCKEGYGGLWCDVKMQGVFENMALYFNHYGHYSKSQKFLIIVEKLGSVPISVELMGDNYVIDSFESTNPQTYWTFTSDLVAIIKKQEGIRYHNDLPFEKGYYHIAEEIFWDLGMQKFTLRVYDTETASELFYQQFYDILILKPNKMPCVPQLKFMHGSNPTDPLMVDIARFNNFEPVVLHRCAASSRIHFEWRVFNSIGNKMLHNFGTTRIPLLKVAPYTLWFNYHGEVMSSYSLVVTMIEQSQPVAAVHEARCFIFVLPKPMHAVVKGGPHRFVSVSQPLILDGSLSRDFALAPQAKQDLAYRWDCVSADDIHNQFCGPNISTRAKLEIGKNPLQLSATYHFTLIVQSKVNLFISDEAHQEVVVIENLQLFLHIECVRNCLRNKFSSGFIIHLDIQCDLSGGKCPQNAQYFWTLNGARAGNDRRCLYRPNESESSLIFMAEVWNDQLTGKASLKLTRNSPPHGGSCSIEPKSGVAFHTEFHIKCEDYQDSDVPLSYQYTVAEFPLERINDPEAVVVLPQCQFILVVICDLLEACIETRLVVNVSVLLEPASLEDFLTIGKSNISGLVAGGHKLASMILVKSLLIYMNTVSRALEVAKHLRDLTPLTLLEVEQWLNICHDLSKNLMPLDNRKSVALNKFLSKLSQGLQVVVDDGEFLEIQAESFERSLTNIATIMNDFAKPWETLAGVHIVQPQVVKALDPLAEHYTQFANFDILSLERVVNWLQTSRELHRCIDILSRQAIYVYNPQETPFTMKNPHFIIQVFVLEDITNQYLNVSNQSIELEISHDVVKDLLRQLQSKKIALHMASMNSNPFWWYPDDRPITTNVFYLSASAENYSPLMQLHLTKPFVSKLYFKQPDSFTSSPEIESVITDHLHMPVFSLQLPPNAAVIVSLKETQMDVLLEISVGRKPRSFQVQKSKQIFKVNNTSSPQRYMATNHNSQVLDAFIAVLATNDTKEFPFSFQFHLNTVECLYWDWDLTDPQWSSKGCKPTLNLNLSQVLQCECDHLSTFAARKYPSLVNENLGDRSLLESLPFNWYLATFYIVIYMVFSGILTYNFRRSHHLNHILISDANNNISDVAVLIYTGSHWNASSSANIRLRFISERGPYSVTIYQSPQKPQLQRNSLCKLYLSSNDVRLPLKLTISNDQSGRYPSWYCHKIAVINLATNRRQLFIINQWISKQSLEVMATSSGRTYKQRFVENLVDFYNNWFQFQPILGPALYSDMCCFQRSCVWVSQFMVSMCIVACYYGPTTLETYEEERELYYSLSFSVTELLLLPLVCFISSVIIKWSFAYFCQ